MILPKVRDPRFVTIRRGGALTDPDAGPRPARAAGARGVPAGQAAVVAHVAARELGAAAYAIKAARAAAPQSPGEPAGRRECRWQRDQLPEAIRTVVLGEQRLRNELCWWVFHR